MKWDRYVRSPIGLTHFLKKDRVSYHVSRIFPTVSS